MNGEGAWVSLLKWKICVFFAYWNEQEIKPFPEFVNIFNPDGGLTKGPARLPRFNGRIPAFFKHPGVILGGINHCWLMALREKDNSMFLSFVDTILLGLKKSMPIVPDCLMAQAVEETVTKLTGPTVNDDFGELKIPLSQFWQDAADAGLEVGEDTFFVDQEMVSNELRRTTREIFTREQMFTYDDIVSPFFPSTNSTYGRSRSKAGPLGFLYDAGHLGQIDPEDGLQYGESECVFNHKVSPFYGEYGVVDQDCIDNGYKYGEDHTSDGSCVVVDDELQREHWKEMYFTLFKQALVEEPYVEALPLAEPIKVRVISKGPCLIYTVLKPFQKWLWRVISSNRCFSLTGKTVTEEDICGCFGSLEEWEEILSGDYKQSTNEIKSWVSEVLVDELFIVIGELAPRELLEQLPENFLYCLKDLFYKALTKHKFVMDSEQNKDSWRPQTNGQLMGSIISFVFLCLANATVCRIAMEKAAGEKVKYRLTDKPYPGGGKLIPALFNGDDCVFKTLILRGRLLWEAVASTAGLSSSIGKTYFSRKFLTVNSVVFRGGADSGEWKQQKYVNMGLMMGKSKSLSRDGEGKTTEYDIPVHRLGEACRLLKESCPEALWGSVKKRFIYYNMNMLKTAKSVPWFMPEWVGGLGLPFDTEEERSEMDRLGASVIKQKMNNDTNYKPVLPKDMVEWQMHRLVRARLEKRFKGIKEVSYRTMSFPDGTELDIEREFSKAYKAMVCDTIMTLPFEMLKNTLKKDRSVKLAIQHNTNLWGKVFRDLSSIKDKDWFHGESLSDQDLLAENKNLQFPIIVSSHDSMEHGLRRRLYRPVCDKDYLNGLGENKPHRLPCRGEPYASVCYTSLSKYINEPQEAGLESDDDSDAWSWDDNVHPTKRTFPAPVSRELGT
jgi:hypothetical protein